MAINRGAIAHLRRRVRDILNTVWDPIGAGCPEDEYDDYVAGIVALLHEEASDSDLVKYLDWAETVRMGLPGNQERLKVVVVALRAISLLN
jgi:hypothetical protein